MTFPAKENIIKRKSVRTFDGKPLSQEDRDLLQVARDDELGRQLQDQELLIRKRASRRKRHVVQK